MAHEFDSSPVHEIFSSPEFDGEFNNLAPVFEGLTATDVRTPFMLQEREDDVSIGRKRTIDQMDEAIIGDWEAQLEDARSAAIQDELPDRDRGQARANAIKRTTFKRQLVDEKAKQRYQEMFDLYQEAGQQLADLENLEGVDTEDEAINLFVTSAAPRLKGAHGKDLEELWEKYRDQEGPAAEAAHLIYREMTILNLERSQLFWAVQMRELQKYANHYGVDLEIPETIQLHTRKPDVLVTIKTHQPVEEDELLAKYREEYPAQPTIDEFNDLLNEGSEEGLHAVKTLLVGTVADQIAQATKRPEVAVATVEKRRGVFSPRTYIAGEMAKHPKDAGHDDYLYIKHKGPVKDRIKDRLDDAVALQNQLLSPTSELSHIELLTPLVELAAQNLLGSENPNDTERLLNWLEEHDDPGVKHVLLELAKVHTKIQISFWESRLREVKEFSPGSAKLLAGQIRVRRGKFPSGQELGRAREDAQRAASPSTG
ncbi:MAG: hypothetical protein R3313_02850 [Candidatus Saccharimonadales bacterium]|nr:hypothetical protein [Candidatus Saccharimonadales bacterium]